MYNQSTPRSIAPTLKIIHGLPLPLLISICQVWEYWDYCMTHLQYLDAAKPFGFWSFTRRYPITCLFCSFPLHLALICIYFLIHSLPPKRLTMSTTQTQELVAIELMPPRIERVVDEGLQVEPLALSKTRSSAIIITIASVSFLNTLGSGLLTVALPRIAKDLDLPNELLLWWVLPIHEQ